MKYLIFVFKHRFRQNSLNNFLKLKKIKDFKIINFSGPLQSIIGKFYILFQEVKYNFYIM